MECSMELMGCKRTAAPLWGDRPTRPAIGPQGFRWDPSSRPRGAGAGPLAACPQGSVQPLGPVAPLAPPSLGGMALACS